jgi:hypothetical protein
MWNFETRKKEKGEERSKRHKEGNQARRWDKEKRLRTFQRKN